MDKFLFPRFVYETILSNNRAYIKCLLRKKYVRLTPEEWVRQHTINYLIVALNYPAGRMRAECKTSKVTGYWQRADILLYNKSKEVSMIVECKSTREKLSEDTLQQMMRYNDVKAPLLVFTNGIQLFCFQRSFSQPYYVKCPKIPMNHDL